MRLWSAGFLVYVVSILATSCDFGTGEEDYVSDEFPLIDVGFAGTYAASYASNWYANPNTYFADFSDPTYGGDCANFASQSILAGLASSASKRTVYNARLTYQDNAYAPNDWWYTSSASRAMPEWAGANGLFNYLRTQVANPSYDGLKVSRVQYGGAPNASQFRLGDIVSLVSGGVAFHTMVVVRTGTNATAEVAYRNGGGLPPRKRTVARVAQDYPTGWYVFRVTGFHMR